MRLGSVVVMDSLSLDQLDLRSAARRTRQPTVASQEPGVECFGQGHIHGVVGAHVIAQFPYPIKKRFV